MDVRTLAATDRLIAIALDDTGQSQRVADFLLSWWNAEHLGGWKPIHLGSLDDAICEDILTVLSTLSKGVAYPYERRAEIEQLQRIWRSKRAA